VYSAKQKNYYIWTSDEGRAWEIVTSRLQLGNKQIRQTLPEVVRVGRDVKRSTRQAKIRKRFQRGADARASYLEW
jgi:hypothetical protein